MKFFNENNIRIIVFTSSIILVAILTIIFGTLYILDKYIDLERDLPLIEKEYIDQQKEILHYAVNLQVNQIDFRRKQIKKRLKESLQSRVKEAKTIADNLYAESTGSMPEAKLKLLRQALGPIRFNQNRGYFFMIGMDGVFRLYPPNPSIEGKVANNTFTGEKLQVIYNLIDLVNSNESGFLEYNWPIPGGDTDRLYKKLSYVTYLKQYDCLVGAGEYYEDFGDMTRQSIIDDIDMSMGEDLKNYFFVYQLHDIRGGKDFATMLINPNRPDLVGSKLSDDFRGAHGKEFRKIFLKDLHKQGESYVTYWYKKAGHEEAKQKLSYFKLYPEWNWVVAKGVYLDDMMAKISLKKQALEVEVEKKLLIFFLVLFMAVGIVIVIAHFFTKGINSIFIDYKNIQEKQHLELERINKYLHEKATTDPLTEIYNRQYFNERLRHEILRAERYNRPLSLIIFDIDFFKQVNDIFGHLAGDGVLKELASLIQSQIRQSDILARWGGEEFVILINETGGDFSHVLAEKLCLLIAEHSFSLKRKITCSFGVTEYHSGESATVFLNRADQALYQAKENGRNQVVSKSSAKKLLEPKKLFN